MTTQYFLPVIHPAFELLKRSSRILHFIAASIILVDGLHFLQEHPSAKLICYLQLIIASEVFLVLFLGKSLLSGSPVLGLFFRVIEACTLMGIGFTLMSYGYVAPVYMHGLLSAGYFFLFYREWRIVHSESINIRQTGIIIPSFINDSEISWNEIKSIAPGYHSICIETFQHKTIHFELRKNLKIEELQQIDEFCRQHLLS